MIAQNESGMMVTKRKRNMVVILEGVGRFMAAAGGRNGAPK